MTACGGGQVIGTADAPPDTEQEQEHDRKVKKKKKIKNNGYSSTLITKRELGR